MNNKFIFVDKNEYEYRNVFSMYNCIRGYENLKSITRNACYTSIIFIIFFFIIIEHKLRIIILPYKKKTTLRIMEYGSYLYSINYGSFVSVFFNVHPDGWCFDKFGRSYIIGHGFFSRITHTHTGNVKNIIRTIGYLCSII